MWDGMGEAADQFRFPQSVAVDGDGDLYVVDQGNHRVQKLEIAAER